MELVDVVFLVVKRDDNAEHGGRAGRLKVIIHHHLPIASQPGFRADG